MYKGCLADAANAVKNQTLVRALDLHSFSSQIISCRLILVAVCHAIRIEVETFSASFQQLSRSLALYKFALID